MVGVVASMVMVIAVAVVVKVLVLVMMFSLVDVVSSCGIGWWVVE